MHHLHSAHHKQPHVKTNYLATCLNSSANLFTTECWIQNISAFQVTFILKPSTPNFVQTFGMWAKKLLSIAQSHDAGGKMTLHGNKAHCILKPTQNQQCFIAILRGFPLVVFTFKMDPTSGPSTSSPAGRELQNNDKIIQELPGCCPKHSTAWKQQIFNSRCSPHSSHFISLTSV